MMTLAKGERQVVWKTKLKLLAVALLTVLAGLCTQHVLAEKPRAEPAPALVPGEPNTIRLPRDVVNDLRLRTREVQAATRERILRWPGSLVLDPERTVRVHSRARGVLDRIAEVEEASSELPRQLVPIRPGSQVRKGQLLAVVWSEEVGVKKGELVDALLLLRTDRVILAKLEDSYKQGTLPEVAVLQARRNVEASQNAANRAERALRHWRLTEEEIKAVKEEVERIGQRQGKRDTETEKNWARLDVRAPLDGIVVERTVSPGDVVGEQVGHLFTISNVDQLKVMVKVPEDDLPTLHSLPMEARKWIVQLPGGLTIEGKIDQLGYLIDPNEHHLLVKGSIANPDHKIRPGQAVKVSITVPVQEEIAVPAAAVLETGEASFVFVQTDPKQPVYQQRRVLVVGRREEVLYLRSPITAEEKRKGYQTVQAGERIVTSHVAELKSMADELKKKDR
jgi:membrane fusion protein, heavy metal efflux system